MPTSLQGKTILVTGATNGIGLVTARELAKMGAQVTIVGRSAEKCAAVAEHIQAAAGTPVEVIVGDLSVMEGVRQVAITFREKHSQLHVLVNNAGGMFTRRVLTADGFEYTFALNHLNYFLLTDLLLDLLKAGAPSRIINVSSVAHENAKIDFDNLQGQKRFVGLEAYGQSKLANLLFTYELARRLEGTGVTANALHPGVGHWLRPQQRPDLQRRHLDRRATLLPQTRAGCPNQYLPGVFARAGRGQREVLRGLQGGCFQAPIL